MSDDKPRNVKDLLVEAKDASELMVDLAYAALRAGMVEPRLVHDRRKSSASALAALTAPLWLAGGAWQRMRLSRKQPELLAENLEPPHRPHGDPLRAASGRGTE